MTVILGISAFYHDSAAAIIRDGTIEFAAQEERYTRKKHDAGFPIHAIRSALKHANVSVAELDAVVFYDKPLLKFERLLETYLANAPAGFLSFARSMPIWLKQKLYLKSLIRRELRQLIAANLTDNAGLSPADAKRRAKQTALPQLLFTRHHQSHAAAAFYPSPFEQAAVICLDGVGEWTSTSIWHGNQNQLTELASISFPHSLGLLYSAFTFYCGFRVNTGEYKLMGLAPYGEPIYQELIETHLITIAQDGSFALNMQYFDYPVGSRMITRKFEKLFDGPALPFDAPITQKQMDIASSIQAVTEKVVLRIAAHAKELTQSDNICLAGGVALNCVANGKLAASNMFRHIWIQPAAGDAGSAVGAALEVNYGYFDASRKIQSCDSMRGSYLGDAFSNEQIRLTCEQQSLSYTEHTESGLLELTAKLISQQKVVGWFHGSMEFGPRALGNRSILGDPRSADMQKKMNLAIKQRESFRPFAPAVLAEDLEYWFEMKGQSPYMLMVAQVASEHCLQTSKAQQGLERVNQKRSNVPAITHVDYSARVQTVTAKSNPVFYQLLTEFKRQTGIGMLINTSFNVRGEPPVCSPEDAIRCFLATDMDYLVMQNIILDKTAMPADAIAKAKQVTFARD